MSTKQTSLFTSMDDTTQKPTTMSTATAPQQETPAHESHPKTAIKSHPRTSSLETIYGNLVAGLKRYFSQNGFRRGVIGVSGGVDSALTLKIAVDALGAENVTAILMPETGLTKEENTDHAKILCQFMQVNCYYQPINPFIANFHTIAWKPNPLAYMNTKARMRAVLLYNYANTENALVLGTSNKSELLLGYGTKFGDLAADVEVIAELFKTEVVKLADYAGLPPEIVHKTPSAELAPGQTDEEEMGATYADMDEVLAHVELGAEGCIARGLDATLVHMVFRRINANKHKTELPHVISAR